MPTAKPIAAPMSISPNVGQATTWISPVSPA
jgi:hypothetical protein